MKILILIMSCNKERFINESNKLKQSYKELIDKYKFQNEIKVYSFIGGYKQNNIDYEKNEIELKADDTIKCVYEKTIKCFEFVNKKIEYDYIVRTNTSQFINIKLLYYFISYLYNNNVNDIVYTGGLCSWPQTIGLNKFDITINGNFMIFHKNIVDILLKNRNIIYELRNKNPLYGTFGHETGYDDIIISTILMYYYRTNDDLSNRKNYLLNYLNHIKNTEQGFYKCWDINKSYEGTPYCKWHNESLDFDYMKQFLSFRLKSNTSPAESNVYKINELFNLFINNDDININKSVNTLLYLQQNSYVHTGWWSNPIYIKLNEIIKNFL